MIKLTAILCFDIGGTSIKYGMYTPEGHLLNDVQSVATNAVGQPILQTIRQIVTDVTTNNRIAGIAISSAGVIDSDKGLVAYSGYTIPNYTGTTFKATLESEFKVRCEVENDVNAACLAEVWQGAAKGHASAVCLTVGTGVGGAVLIDGKLVKGIGNTAGEIGYMSINGHYFQDIASTTFLIQRVNELSPATKFVDGKAIFAGAKAGEKTCIQGVNELIDNLASGLINIIYLLNPEIIVLGGGIMSQKAYLSDKLVERVSEKLVSPMFDKTVIKFAENENNAGMLGALYHFNQLK